VRVTEYFSDSVTYIWFNWGYFFNFNSFFSRQKLLDTEWWTSPL